VLNISCTHHRNKNVELRVREFAYLVHYSIEQRLRSDNNNNGKQPLDTDIERLKAEKQPLEADKNLQPEDETGKRNYFEGFKKRLTAYPIIFLTYSFLNVRLIFIVFFREDYKDDKSILLVVIMFS